MYFVGSDWARHVYINLIKKKRKKKFSDKPTLPGILKPRHIDSFWFHLYGHPETAVCNFEFIFIISLY